MYVLTPKEGGRHTPFASGYKQPMPAIRLFGLPTDVNSSFERGAAAGPAAIRAALRSERGNLASELGPEIGVDIAFADDGDLPLSEDTARDDAVAETNLPLRHFPEHCPYALDEVMDGGFWPGGAELPERRPRRR